MTTKYIEYLCQINPIGGDCLEIIIFLTLAYCFNISQILKIILLTKKGL